MARRRNRRTDTGRNQLRRRRLASGLERLESRQLLAGDVTLFADSFESGGSSNDWVGNWAENGQNDWFRSTQRATDGVYSAEVDGSATVATLTLATPLDLTSYDSVQLTFDWLIENSFDGGEYLALDVSSDGGLSWERDVRLLSGNVDAENVWHTETVDLTPLASSNVLVRFRSLVDRSNEDANVDNVRITAIPFFGEPRGEFIALGFLSGQSDSSVLKLSQDGRFAVGTSGSEGFRWDRTSGMISVGAFTADDVSADGSVVVGGDGISNAYRWENGVVTVVGDLTTIGRTEGDPGGTRMGSVHGLSADGTVMIGNTPVDYKDEADSFRIVGTEIQPIGDLPGGKRNSGARAVSADGTVVVGRGNSVNGDEAYRWEDGVFTPLGDLPGGIFESLAWEVSANNQYVVGQSSSSVGTEAYRWSSETGMVGLGHLPGETTGSKARGITADGSIVVGVANQGQAIEFWDAFIWDEPNGMRNLKSVLINEYGLGDALAGWELNRASAISDDGLVMAGLGTNPSGQQEAWVVELDPPPELTIDYPDFSNPIGISRIGTTAVQSNELVLSDDRWGGAWADVPQFVSTSFETEFTFRMQPSNSGFAFVVHGNQDLMLGKSLGYTGIPNSLAIEFDSAQGSTDPNDNHVAIHSLGIERNDLGPDSLLASATSPVDLDDGTLHTAKLSYSPGSLQVFVDDAFTPLIDVSVNLDDLLDLDLGRATAGFTASDAGIDLSSWTFTPQIDLTNTVGISDVTVIEGDNGSTQVLATVTRFGTGEVSVDWNTSDGTAIAGADYVSASGMLTFLANDPANKTITLEVLGDSIEEGDESFNLNLNLASGAAVLVDGLGEIVIANDDTSLSIGDATANEGDSSWQLSDVLVERTIDGLNESRGMDIGPDGNLYITSERGALPGAVFHVDINTGDVIGVLRDVTLLSGAKDLEFDESGNLYVTNNVDHTVIRFDATTGTATEFVSPLSGGLFIPRGLTFGPDTTGDTIPELLVASAGTDEILKYDGATGDFIGAFVSAGSGTLDQPTALVFGPDDGHLYVAGGAHTGPNQILKFDGSDGSFIKTLVSSGATSLDLAPTGGLLFGPDVTGDGLRDLYVSNDGPDEILVFDTSNGSLAETLVASGQGGLSDPKGLVFDTGGNLLVDNNGTNEVLRYGTKDAAVFEVTLAQPSAYPVTVDYYTTLDGTADSSDYTGVSGTLTFPPGVTTRTITVPTIDDTTGESSETFKLVLSNSSGASIADDTGIATIIDDDSNGAPVAIDDAAATETDVEQIIDVLANDSDPDGDPLVVDSVDSLSAEGGTVVINADNSLSYTSALGFTGIDTFSYTISDGQGGFSTATVTVDVSAPSSITMFVDSISFQSRKGGKEWRAAFEIRDENGLAVSGATIVVTFDDVTFSGQTDNNGLFRTDWLRLPSGSYQAEVIDLALLDHSWDTTQGWLGDTDGDGLPDRLLSC